MPGSGTMLDLPRIRHLIRVKNLFGGLAPLAMPGAVLARDHLLGKSLGLRNTRHHAPGHLSLSS